LVQLFQDDKPSLGVLLGRSCINANLSASHVAEAFEVTRATLHCWFRGATIKKSREAKVKVFIDLVAQDTATGQLPVRTAAQSKSYIEAMLGRAI
jgi:hypothetical protein